jgi:long-chain acyl-CoA synthetase
MSYPSLPQAFLEAIDRFSSPRAALRKVGGQWEPVSSSEILRRTAGLSHALHLLGIKSGDRVGLISANRPEWHISDFAILGLGAANVPIYFRESADRLVYILNDSGARVAIATGPEQARLLLSCRPRLPAVEQIIIAEAAEERGKDLLRYETLIATSGEAEIAEYRRRAAEVTLDQIATILYTSGTTGEPKGVMLTHLNLSSNAFDSMKQSSWGPADVGLSFLPLSHVYERIIDYNYLFRGTCIAYLERIEEVQQALLEVRPTLIASVPRLFEKTYANVMEQGHRATGLKRRLFDWGLSVADRSVPWRAYGKPATLGLKIAWSVADWLLFSKIRRGLGGRLREISSGGAPLASELAEFFWSIGLPIYQGYGLTETSPIVSTNAPGANKVGTVGRPIDNVEVRIADDGEILVHGPCVMHGYYQKPEDTRAVLSEDGWLCTGDIGYLDADGYLVVTDRKKELLKTAGGKLIAPQPIENRLKSSPFILNCAIVGDKRKFIAALIVPNFPNVEAKDREAGIMFASNSELVAHPWVRQLIESELTRLCAGLAQYEKPKRFALLDKDFTTAAGELTYTLKLKRRVIEQHYHAVIEQLYADVEEPRPHRHA